MTLPPSNTSAPGDADQTPVGSTSSVRAESTPPASPGSPIFTRSKPDLSEHLDAHATEHVAQMVNEGWDPGSAADAWQDYAEIVVQAAADGALLEGSWEAS